MATKKKAAASKTKKASTKKAAKTSTESTATSTTEKKAAAKKTTKKAAKKSTKKATKKAAKKTTRKSTSKAKAKPKVKKMTTKSSTKTAKKTTKKATKKPSSAAAQKKAAKAAEAAMRDIIARARDHFRRAPDEHTFVLSSGHQLRDLRELAEALDDMHEHTFGHHVNDERHDFANWVHEVLQERALAEQLRQAERHPKAHQHVIYRHIVRRVW